MADFESDNVDLLLSTYNILYANIPVGSLVMIAGPVSLYSNASYVNSGLLPCNGTVRAIATYPTLYNIITQNGTVFPFGTNTLADGVTAGSTHFKLPDMLTTKYFLIGSSSSNISIPNSSAIHTHTASLTTSLAANNTAWDHAHIFTASTDTIGLGTHNHNYVGAFNASSAGNGSSVIAKADGTSVAASTTHSHGTLGVNAPAAATGLGGGPHAHNVTSATSNTTNAGSHTHSASSTLSDTSAAVYPSFQNFLYFVKA